MSPSPPTKSLACALIALALAVPARAAPALASWGSLPVTFEPNRGQTHPSVDFIARSGDGVGLLAGGALTLRFDRCARARGCRTYAVRMHLAGARPRKPEALEPLPGIASYFLGSDPSRWVTGIPTYGQVLYREVRPGVDLRYHGAERHLELDMVLAPGASPDRLRLAFDGADRVAVDPKGDLLLTVADQSLTLRRPVAYQEIAGERRAVAAEYVVKGERAVAIALGERDRSQPVVVDPVLVYSAQIGGTDNDGLEAVAVDSSGAVYATGYGGFGFPIVGGTQGYGTATDVVVLKLDPSGANLVYSVYLGGAFSDHAYGIAVGADGTAVVAGETLSGNYPVVNPIQGSLAGGVSDAFVTKVNPTGTGLVYSTYVGGSQSEAAGAVAVDSSGNAYITGGTQSSNWVVTTATAVQTSKAGGRDVFVLKLSPSGSRLYSTFVGGQQEDNGQGIAVDGAGNMLVAGTTTSPDFPTSNPYQSSNGGGTDAFVLKISSGGNPLVFSTYLGGSADDTGEGLALHYANSGVVVAGQTLSTNFPTTAAAYDTTANGGSDGYVAELSSTGTLTFSTYLGGSGNDTAMAVAQPLTGGPWVAGRTASSDFPTAGGAYQSSETGAGDVFVAQLGAGGGTLSYATYLGGTDNDRALGIAVDGAGGTYVVGESGAAFPTTPSAYQSPGLLIDAFVAKLREPFTLTQVNPATGPTAGGTQVVLSGTGFTPNLLASFGDASVPATYAGATTLVANAPPHAAGQVDVLVVSLDGTKSNPIPNGFTYVPGPAPDGGTDGGAPDGGGGGGDGGVPGGPIDLLGCSCAAGVSSSTAFAFAMLVAIAARARQRRRPTSAPPSQ